jgi:hypothetical protein
VPGECSVQIHDAVVKGIEYHAFTAAASCGDRLALVCHDRLAIVVTEDFTTSVHDDHNCVNIIDAIQIADSDTFIVVTSEDNRLQLGIAPHPLSQPRVVIDDPSRHDYIGIASVSSETRRFVGVIVGQSLKLFEFSGHLLEVRSTLNLDHLPFAIELFGQRFLVAFSDKIELYQTEIVSASDVHLRKISEMPTQGSASFVTCDDEIVAIADEVQSVVLYTFTDSTNKFEESARCTSELGVHLCAMRGDDYFVIDHSGNFYQMVIGETKNIESYDLIVLSCFSLGNRATAIQILPSDTPRLLIATETGQYMEVVSFLPPPEFDNLYTLIEGQVQSLGRLNSRMYRTVMIRDYLFPAPLATTLDLLKMFMKLDEASQMAILRPAGIRLEDARTICTQVLSYL